MRIVLLILFTCVCFRLPAQRILPLQLLATSDSISTIHCSLKGSFYGKLCIEQFRWNRWCIVDTISEGKWTDTTFDVQPFLHSGLNQFRLVAIHANPFVLWVRSNVTEIFSNVDCQMHSRCNGDFEFSTVTSWEIRNERDSVVAQGRGNFIRHSSYPKGRYFLFYNNNSTEFYFHPEKD